MEAKSIMDFLASAYLYGWAGTFIFFILFVITLRQNTARANEQRKLQDELSKKDEQVSDLEADVNNLREELEEKSTKLTDLEAKVTSLESSLSSCENQKKELEEQVNNLKEENSNLTKGLRETESSLAEAERKIKDLEDTVKTKDLEISGLKSTVSELKELEEKYNFAILYIHMKKLYDEFQEEFTQNILKGISNMKISDIDIVTAQRLFEKAMETYYKHEKGEVPPDFQSNEE